MNKRQLSVEEQDANEKALKRYEDNKVLYRIETKILELNHMIDRGVYVNFLDKLDELKERRKNLQKELDETKFMIDILKDQIENGVEVKISQEENNGIS